MNEEEPNIVSRRARILIVVAGVALGAVTGVLAHRLQHDIDTAVAWGLAVAAIVAGLDPRWFLGPAVLFLLLPPVFILLGEGARAERAALTAFYFLLLGVALEFRQDLARRTASVSSQTDSG